ncbi:MAG: hypothetical protein M3261_00335 [Thermoproteota archaeon]|nr:hypothetical protein [Thermoproteota archaeon]
MVLPFLPYIEKGVDQVAQWFAIHTALTLGAEPGHLQKPQAGLDTACYLRIKRVVQIPSQVG